MSDKTLSVRIKATDDASKVLKNLGDAADNAGDDLERAGKQGSDGLQKIETQSKTTAASMESLQKRATAVGAAIGTLAGGAAYLGREFREQERQIDGINRLYGDQADAVLEASENIQDYTRYSNDAARESFLLASSLVGNYQLSTENLELLIERSADLAQIYGFSLPDAVQRTSAALRGEGESAERLGLNMSDAAIAAQALDSGITNWNVPGALSEAEKAAFRFQVFLEQSATASGAAADGAANAGGRFRQFANDVQDAGQSIGGFLGPVGEVAAEMAPIAIAAPVVAAGLGRISAGLAGAAGSARLASVGLGAVSLLTSPLAIGLGAVAVAGWGVSEILENIEENASGTAEGLGILIDEVERLKLAAQPEAAAQVQEIIDSIEAQIELFSGDLTDLIAKGLIPEGTLPIDLLAPGGLNDQLSDAESRVDEFAAHITATMLTLSDPAAQQRYLDWVTGLLGTIASGVEGTNLDEIIETVITTPASEVPGVMDEITDATTTTTMALAALAAAAPLVSAGFNAIRSDGERMSGTMVSALTTLATTALETYHAQERAIDGVHDAQLEFLSDGDNVLDWWEQYQITARGAIDEYGRMKQEALETGQALQTSFADLPVLGADAFGGLVDWAQDIEAAGRSLDQALRIFEQIDSLGQRSSSAGAIADALFGPDGDPYDSVGPLRDIYDSGIIGQTTFNDAVSAGISIQESNVRVQDDLNAVRAQQLPLLAEEQAAYEQNIAALAEMEPLEQRRALMLQDSAVQSQIASAYATAYSASLGEIPEEVASDILINTAQADPAIADLLVQMGLLNEEMGPNGEKTYSVNFPDAESTASSIDRVTQALIYMQAIANDMEPIDLAIQIFGEEEARDLYGTLDENDGKTSTVTVNAEDEATPIVNAILALMDNTDGDTATVTVNAVDNATGVIGAAAAGLAALNGSRATTYVDTVYSGRPGVGYSEFAMGGMVLPRFANGGMVPFWAGENGPEIAHFANGGTALLPHEGMYAAPPMTYISPNNASSSVANYGGATTNVYVNIEGSVTGEVELLGRFAQAISEEVQRHHVASGLGA